MAVKREDAHSAFRRQQTRVVKQLSVQLVGITKDAGYMADIEDALRKAFLNGWASAIRLAVREAERKAQNERSNAARPETPPR